ncbi:MAG: DUF4159 domain-containing protein [Planctomycetota bacterium]
MKTTNLTFQKVVAACCVALAFIGASALAIEKAGPDDKPCGLLPEAKPQRIKGGEATAPLPLPATPLRRSERKREPAPPTLVGKLMWGQHREVEFPDGRKAAWDDWNTDPSDMARLMKFANEKLNVRYRHVNIDPKTFSWDPSEVPVVYIQGRRAPQFDDATRKKLRDFVLNGGYIWADACTGSSTLAEAFRAEIKTIFPDRPLAVLPVDHPVYRSSFEITKVKYSPACNRLDETPVMEGMYVGCRTAVFLFPYDLSCAWDSFHVPAGGKCIVGEDAMRMGINLCAYTISYYNLGRYLSQRKALDTDEDNLKGDFVFAQVKTNGLWDPHPSAFANVLKTTLAATNTKVNFGRKEVPITDANLLSYPFLYLTGHGEFTLNEAETANLKKFLNNGGFLLADACCGNLEFDRAFRREIKKVLPESEMKLLPKEHPVFSTLHKLETIEYSAQVKASIKDATAPILEGIALGEDTRVIYSRFGLGSGWDGQERPYAYEIMPNDSLKMGVNIILYSMTH